MRISTAGGGNFGSSRLTLLEDRVQEIPKDSLLQQNYPNPFNPSTEILYTLETSTTVSLIVYDVLGRELATLVNGRYEPGEHTVTWNAEHVPGGVYF